MAEDGSRSISARAAQIRSNEHRRSYSPRSRSPDSAETARVPSPPASGPTANGSSPANLVRTRRRAFRPSERLARQHRDRTAQNYAQPTAHARSASPLPESDPYAGRDFRARAKRRKLDDGNYDSESKAISYGHKGQVVPGQLKLEIASCDGGEYQDPNNPVNSWPQNVLQDDLTVYCTKSNRCNMLLRHVTGMPFSLTKIVVKAPLSGYDAPIQEGMIFVAMSDDDLLEKTSQFETHYSPRNYRQHRHHFERTRPSHEYMSSTRSPLRHIDRARFLRNPSMMLRRFENDPLLETALIPGFEVTTGAPSDDEAPAASPPSPRPWRYSDPDEAYTQYVDRYRPRYHESGGIADDVDLHSNESSDSDDLADHLAVAADMVAELEDMGGEQNREGSRILNNTRRDARRAALMRRNAEQSNHYDEDTDSDVPSASGPRATAISGTGPSTRHQAAPIFGYQRIDSDAEPTAGKSPSADDTIAPADSSSLRPSDITAPHARFFIPRSRSSVAVKFDPPV